MKVLLSSLVTHLHIKSGFNLKQEHTARTDRLATILHSSKGLVVTHTHISYTKTSLLHNPKITISMVKCH